MAPQPDTAIDLDQMHDAIVSSIATAFPTFITVEAYREDRTLLQGPACLIELVDMEPSAEEDPGTEQLAALTRWEARIIIGMRTPDAKRAAPKLAAALALHIRRQRWALPVTPAEVTSIEPDDFSPVLDQYEVWRVDWQQLVHFGESVWTDEGTLPTLVMSAFGAAAEADFDAVTDPDLAPDGQWDDDAQLTDGLLWGEER